MKILTYGDCFFVNFLFTMLVPIMIKKGAFLLSDFSDEKCVFISKSAKMHFINSTDKERRMCANLPCLFILLFYFILFYFILFYLVADDDDEQLEPKTKLKPIARKTSSSDMSPEVRRHLSKFMK
jgi:hypothetical protein